MADDNNMTKFASQGGSFSVIKLSLADPRVNPTAQRNGAIKVASQGGHISVVKLLLADPAVEPRGRGLNIFV